MPLPLRVVAVIALSGGLVWAVSSEVDWVRKTAMIGFCVVMATALIASSSVRDSVADAMPPLTWVAHAGFGLRGRAIALTVAGAVAAIVVAEIVQAVTRPQGELADHVARRAPEVAALPPIRAAEALERGFPAEDQRYTPWGVFLRYEDDVVALLPKSARTTTVQRLPDDEAYVKYGAILGRFWGPAYHDYPDGVRESAMPVPREIDLRAAAAALADAERVHDACYGWDVEVVSGAAKGHLLGTGSGGVGARIGSKCRRSVVLEGTIDPLAGRYTRKGDPGDWSLGVRHRLFDGEFPRASFEAISVPFVEMIEGSTTEPSDGGAIQGKGLLELIGALPLLAQEADGLTTVPLPRPLRPSGPLAAVERTDAERRAQRTVWGIATALLRVGAGSALVLLLGGLLCGLVTRLVRGVASRPGHRG